MRLSTNYASLLMISQKINLFILQDIWELCFVLLCETLHEIRAISNRDLDRNISDSKEKSTVKAMGESILTGFNPRPWLSLFWEFKNSICLLVYSRARIWTFATTLMCLSYLLFQWQAALGWLCCLSLLALLVGLPYILKETPANPSVPHALYQGLHRPLWALAVTWIILACEEGYGGNPGVGMN